VLFAFLPYVFLVVLSSEALQTTAIMKWLAGLASLLSQPAAEGVAGPVVCLGAVLRPLYRISSNHAGLAVPGEHRASTSSKGYSGPSLFAPRYACSASTVVGHMWQRANWG